MQPDKFVILGISKGEWRIDLEYYGTLGPACQSADTVLGLLRAGMTGVRLNLSHGGLRQREKWLKQLEGVSRAFGCAPKLLIDLQGPELRIGDIPQPLALQEGERCRLGEGGIPAPGVLLDAIETGTRLLIDDGALELEANQTDAGGAWCIVRRGGVLWSKKSIAAPEIAISLPALTKQDKENLALMREYGVTQVMLPFVRKKADVLSLRSALDNEGLYDAEIFAKLENQAGGGRPPRDPSRGAADRGGERRPGEQYSAVDAAEDTKKDRRGVQPGE